MGRKGKARELRVDAADSEWAMGRIWPSLRPRRMSYGPKWLVTRQFHWKC